MTTLYQHLAPFIVVPILLSIASFNAGWAYSTLTPQRTEAIEDILPYFSQIDALMQTSSKDSAAAIELSCLKNLDKNWLQQAQFTTVAALPWRGYHRGSNAGNTIDVFAEYAYYKGKFCKIASFFHRQDVALMLLDVPGKPTVIVLNRAAAVFNSKGVSSNMQLFSLSNTHPVPPKRSAMSRAVTQELIPDWIQGEYISTERKSIVEIWRTPAPVILRDSMIKMLDRSWKLYTVHEIPVPGETKATMYRMLAFNRAGQPAYFTLRRVGGYWRLRLNLEQSDKLGQDFYELRLHAKAQHLNGRYVGFAIQSFFLLNIVFGLYSLNKSRKLTRQRDHANLALTGLRARLNPHFLFNTLGSIQDLLNQQDFVAANRYFSEMAQLLRYVVDAAAHERVLLKDELDALNKYCSLEALRTPFEYSFEVNPKVDLENTEIPSMLLQPFVENAILHGLRPGDQPKQLKLKVTLDRSDHLIIVILDSGIGIEESRRRNYLKEPKRSHQGMALTDQRIDWLNVGKTDLIELEIQDRRRISPDQTGTKVRLSIPL